MGMVRQWQELLHEKNYSESYTAALPDFVKLAESYGCVGMRAKTPDELDEKIKEMINVDRPVIFDCLVKKDEKTGKGKTVKVTQGGDDQVYNNPDGSLNSKAMFNNIDFQTGKPAEG